MLFQVILSLCMNISILIVLATLLSRLKFFRVALVEDPPEAEGRPVSRKTVLFRLGLGLIFGGFCVISDYIGIQVKGAIPNARMIGILSAGLLGGPVSGMTSAVIGAVHRYLIFPERASTTACVAATVLQGIMGSAAFYKSRGKRVLSYRFLFALGIAAGALHLALTLLMTKPFAAALEISYHVILPMMLLNAAGMVIFFDVFNSIFVRAELEVASRVSLSLRIAERCVEFLNGDVITEESAALIVKEITDESVCEGAAIIEHDAFLAHSAAFQAITLQADSYPRLLMAAKTYRTTRISQIPKPEDAFYPLYGQYAIVAAPMVTDSEKEPMVLVVLFNRRGGAGKADVSFAQGLADYLAAQIRLAAAERQRAQLREAQLQALQAQINPHFLFNALNTISCLCREEPERARELLLALSAYFRNMLEDANRMVSLETELERVRAYVKLEEARFEERLSVTISAKEEDCRCMVPSLILQPIVENAIRHGATKTEHGIVNVSVSRDDTNTLIDIYDNGPGIDQQAVDRLRADDSAPLHTDSSGHGLGMRNVQRRLKAVYGQDAGLQILSSSQGTLLRMVIPDAALPKYTQEGAQK